MRSLLSTRQKQNWLKQYCAEHGLTLQQIWLTHWHKDHVGGVPALIQDRNIPIYGPRAELSRIPWINFPLDHDDIFEFHGLKVEVTAVPGHTPRPYCLFYR